MFFLKAVSIIPTYLLHFKGPIRSLTKPNLCLHNIIVHISSHLHFSGAAVSGTGSPEPLLLEIKVEFLITESLWIRISSSYISGSPTPLSPGSFYELSGGE